MAARDIQKLTPTIISVTTAMRQAAEQGHSLAVEIKVLVVHGLLHLNGYEDAAANDAKRMRKTQERIMKLAVMESAA